MLGIDGALTTRTDGLGQQLQRNQKDQDALEVRLDGDREARLRAQYTALDTAMAQLQRQSSYITQQIAAWNASDASELGRQARRGRSGAARPVSHAKSSRSGLSSRQGRYRYCMASPHRERHRSMFAPATPSATASSAFAGAYRTVGVETGVAAATPHQLVTMLFDGFDDAIAAGPRRRSRRARSRRSARRSRAPCGSSTKA